MDRESSSPFLAWLNRAEWQKWQARFFAPPFVLSVSVVAALVLAALVAILFSGDSRVFLLYYYVPITVPFVAFLFDRVENWNSLSQVQVRIDLPILALALTRAFILVPLISGHALFLSYAWLTTRSTVARLTALLVLVEVAYIKIFVWHDVTLLGGLALGTGAAVWFRTASLGRAQRPAK